MIEQLSLDLAPEAAAAPSERPRSIEAEPPSGESPRVPGDELGVVALCVAIATRFGEISERLRGGELPRLGDERQPWTFRGWLLPYVVDPRAGSRWSWWMEAVVGGRVTGPPPRLELHAAASSDPAYRNIEGAAELVSRSHTWSSGAPGVLAEWLAWGLGVTGSRQPAVDDELAAELYRRLNLDLWHERPADYLGHLMCEYKGRGYDPLGFFPTPQHLCDVITGLTFGGEPSAETVSRSVNDPCVGTGRFLLSASNWSARLSGQDVSRTCVLATLVNGAVYAPWMTWPIPERAFAGLEVAA